jgi:hypothetical protein
MRETKVAQFISQSSKHAGIGRCGSFRVLFWTRDDRCVGTEDSGQLEQAHHGCEPILFRGGVEYPARRKGS